MFFTEIAQLPASRVNVNALRQEEAMWEGYARLCNLVRGCGAPAESAGASTPWRRSPTR
ncbi:hypothetical protein ACVW0K_007336 [Streptomyces filamentosus]